MNSHYIPQFILRNFCVENKITYCDLVNRKAELRNTRSVFAEQGYYPEGIEKDLCKKAEYLFANLYHNKLENARNTIILTSDELFILKKYLIVTSIRYRYEYTEDDFTLMEKLGNAFKVEFIESLNKILKCETIDEMFQYLVIMNKYVDINMLDKLGENSDVNVVLWAEIKDVLHSYIVFVKTRGNENLLIPDIGKGIYEGPMSRRKMTGLLEYTMSQGNPAMVQILAMLTPHDYTVFPLSKDMAVLSMSTFFKLLTDSEIKMNVILPEDCPTVSSVLGFGSKDVITPPKVRNNRGIKEYIYDIKQVNAMDVSHFNCLMLAEAQHHIACSDLSSLRRTLELAKEYTDRDISFMQQYGTAI